MIPVPRGGMFGYRDSGVVRLGFTSRRTFGSQAGCRDGCCGISWVDNRIRSFTRARGNISFVRSYVRMTHDGSLR